MIYTAYLNLKTVSEANRHEHWRTVHARKKKQKKIVRDTLSHDRPVLITPIIVTLTRIAPRSLDDDNLTMAFKAIRDEVAAYINPGKAPGRADNMDHLSWAYAQKRGQPKEYAILIEIECSIRVDSQKC